MAQAASAPSGLHIHSAPSESETETPTKTERRSYYAEHADDQAVVAIRKKFGFSTDSDAVRFALRLAASESIKWTLEPKSARRILVSLMT